MSLAAPKVDFDSALFVNRIKEREIFERVWTGVEKERRFLEFTGIAGQGKSELLKYFFTEARQPQKSLAAYVDFFLSEYHRPEIHPILETIAVHLCTDESDPAVVDFFADFKKAFDIYLIAFRKYQRQAWEDPRAANRKAATDAEKEMIQKFNDALSQILQSYKVVICLDSAEKAYLAAVWQFEESVLQFHADNPNLIVVVAGQQQLNWTLNKLRNRLSRHDLGRFDENASRQFMAKLAAGKSLAIEDQDGLFQAMFHLTLGHPYSSYKFLDFLSDGFRHALSRDALRDLYDRSIKELIAKVIRDRILEEVNLGSDYPPAEKVLQYLAPLRRVEFGAIWFMLTRFSPEWFETKPFQFFEDMIAEFQQSSHVFTPWTLGTGFDLEEVTRNILLAHLRINEPDHFKEIQEILTRQYDLWVSQTRDASQIKNMVEKLYHQAMLLTEQREKNIGGILEEELQRYLNTYFTLAYLGTAVRRHEQRERLRKTLEADAELASLVSLSRLTDMVKNHP